MKKIIFLSEMNIYFAKTPLAGGSGAVLPDDTGIFRKGRLHLRLHHQCGGDRGDGDHVCQNVPRQNSPGFDHGNHFCRKLSVELRNFADGRLRLALRLGAIAAVKV